jgi:hypothetical protein
MGKRKTSSKAEILDKSLPQVQVLRNRIASLQKPEEMQTADFKALLLQALTSIVDLRAPHTWEINLSLGDGFFSTFPSTSFIASITYKKEPNPRKSNSVFAQLIELVDLTRQQEFILVFFAALKEQLQTLRHRAPLPGIFSGQPEHVDRDIDTMIEGMKNMLFIQVIHKGTSAQLQLLLSSSAYQDFNVNVRTEIRNAALSGFERNFYSAGNLPRLKANNKKAISVTAFDAILLEQCTPEHVENIINKITLLTRYGLHLSGQHANLQELIFGQRVQGAFSPELIIAQALRAYFDAKAPAELAVRIITALLKSQYPDDRSVPLTDWMACIAIGPKELWNLSDVQRRHFEIFKHYFHTVMSELIKANAIVAPTDYEANILALTELGFWTLFQANATDRRADLIASLGKTPSDLWPEDLYSLLSNLEVNQTNIHRLLTELLLPIFTYKAEATPSSSAFEQIHDTYTRDFSLEPIEGAGNPRFSKLFPLIEGFCAVENPQSIVTDIPGFTQLITDFKLISKAYYNPLSADKAQLVTSDVIELTKLLIHVVRKFAPGNERALESLKKFCANILKALVFYQDPADLPKSTQLIEEFMNILGPELYAYFIDSWLKDLQQLAQTKTIQLGSAINTAVLLPLPEARLLNKVITRIVNERNKFITAAQAISNVTSAERQSLIQKISITHQAIEALFFRSKAVCDDAISEVSPYNLLSFLIYSLENSDSQYGAHRHQQVLRQLSSFEKSTLTIDALLKDSRFLSNWIKIASRLEALKLDPQQFPKCTQLPLAVKTLQRRNNALTFKRFNRQNVHTESANISARESADKLVTRYNIEPESKNEFKELYKTIKAQIESELELALSTMSIEEQTKAFIASINEEIATLILSFFPGGPTQSSAEQRAQYIKVLWQNIERTVPNRLSPPNAFPVIHRLYKALTGLMYICAQTIPAPGYSFLTTNLLRAVILAINDSKIYKERHPIETEDEITKMMQGLRQQLLVALMEIVISYKQTTPPKEAVFYCGDGIVKRLLQVLDKIHPDVNLYCFDTETLRGMLTESVDTHFARLSLEEQQQIITCIRTDVGLVQGSTVQQRLTNQLYSAVIPQAFLATIKQAYLTKETAQQLTLEQAIQKGLVNEKLIDSYFPRPDGYPAELEVPLIGCQRIILYWQMMLLLEENPLIEWSELKVSLSSLRVAIDTILKASDNEAIPFGDHLEFLEYSFNCYKDQHRPKQILVSPKAGAAAAELGFFGDREKHPIKRNQREEPISKRKKYGLDEALDVYDGDEAEDGEVPQVPEKRIAEEDLQEEMRTAKKR